MLPVIPFQRNYTDLGGIAFALAQKAIEGGVGTAVVHQNQLRFFSVRIEGTEGAFDKPVDVVGLVQNRHDDGNATGSGGIALWHEIKDLTRMTLVQGCVDTLWNAGYDIAPFASDSPNGRKAAGEPAKGMDRFHRSETLFRAQRKESPRAPGDGLARSRRGDLRTRKDFVCAR